MSVPRTKVDVRVLCVPQKSGKTSILFFGSRSKWLTCLPRTEVRTYMGTWILYDLPKDGVHPQSQNQNRMMSYVFHRSMVKSGVGVDLQRQRKGVSLMEGSYQRIKIEFPKK